MKESNFLCVAGSEIINDARSEAYGIAGLAGSDFEFYQESCPALADTYVSPSADPAPWYTASHPESAGFLGVLSENFDLSSVITRQSVPRHDVGSTPGAEQISSRIVDVTGLMVATGMHSMYYGKRWLTEALRGSLCLADCAGDVATVLPFCDGAGNETDFRDLVNASLVSGPSWGQVVSAECLLQSCHFQIEAGMPWLYDQPVVSVNDAMVAAGNSSCALISTDDWFDGEALTITLQATDAAASTGITVTLTFSLDGTCPETRVPASITYTIPSITRSGGITIDAVRRLVTYHDPTAKRDEPGFRFIDWGGGPFCWPVVPACSKMCVCLTNAGPEDVSWRLERRKRAL